MQAAAPMEKRHEGQNGEPLKLGACRRDIESFKFAQCGRAGRQSVPSKIDGHDRPEATQAFGELQQAGCPGVGKEPVRDQKGDISKAL
jgi:hypothetical protein